MNRRMIFNAVGLVLRVEAFLLLLPAICSAIYREREVGAFLIAAAVSMVIGVIPKLILKPNNHVIYAKEGFIIVTFTWIMLSLIGALPFLISGEIPNVCDAIFETVSGFTTTGASIVNDVEALSHGALLWRSFTHWVGGMGIIVFVTAILPNVSERPIHILRAEMPGPTLGKLVPKIKDTAVILYLIYIAMTVLEAVLLLLGGMPLFDSIVHAFGTAGTGGFSIKRDGIAGYSPYCQWIITVFMFLFGVNFNLYYLLLAKKVKTVLKSSELWCYFGIVLAAIIMVTFNIRFLFGSFSEAVRASSFQVTSIISTTGFSTVNFNEWPTFSKTILLSLMFVGGCAGSTAGGIKVSRIAMMFKMVRNEIGRLLHPRSVSALRFEGKMVDDATKSNVGNYFLIYFICFFMAFFLIGFEPFSLETNITATVTCFNNVGPGFAAVGPASNFAAYSGFSKIILSIAMLLGRLEIYPIIIAFSPSAWARNK